MPDPLSPVCYIVTVPYGPSSMVAGPFTTRDDAVAFADAFMDRVDVPAGSLTIGPMYAGDDVLGLLHD